MARESVNTLAERIARVEEQTKRLPKIEDKLDKFIDAADKKYATKNELAQHMEAMTTKNKEQDTAINWNKTKLLDLMYKVGVLFAIFTILTKQFNLW